MIILEEQEQIIPEFEVIEYDEDEDDDIYKGYGEGWLQRVKEE